MAVEEIKKPSSVSYQYQAVGSQRAESKDTSESQAKPSNITPAVSVSISTASSRSEFVTKQEESLQRAQARFDAISSDGDSRASQEALVAIRDELKAKGRETPGLDRAIANFPRIEQRSDGGLQSLA